MKRTTEPAAAMTSAVVNGKFCELSGPPGRSLLAFLRTDLGLTGAKPGCGQGACGACTVLVDGGACRAFGTDRLLFGTDYPYCSEQEFRHHFGYLSESGLNTDELRHVKGGTAAALLLPGHPAAANQEFPAAYA